MLEHGASERLAPQLSAMTVQRRTHRTAGLRAHVVADRDIIEGHRVGGEDLVEKRVEEAENWLALRDAPAIESADDTSDDGGGRGRGVLGADRVAELNCKVKDEIQVSVYKS